MVKNRLLLLLLPKVFKNEVDFKNRLFLVKFEV